jgi:hypothetical protein
VGLGTAVICRFAGASRSTPPPKYDNPLQHIHNQLKSALTTLIASVRHVVFTGYSPEERLRSQAYNMENGFAIFGGDFIITEDLEIITTEAQSAPDIGDENSKTRYDLNSRLFTTKLAMLEQIIEQEEAQ